MTYLIRIEGTEEHIEALRSELVSKNVTVSQLESVNADSRQLSSPFAAPEVMEALNFITALVQATGAGFTLLVAIRGWLKDGQEVLVERNDTGDQLKISRSTKDEELKQFDSKH